MSDKPGTICKHPPGRLYAWFARDGVLCVGCCACGAVLKGGVALIGDGAG